MFKLILLLLSSLFLFADSMNFKEKRFIAAINQSIQKKGAITFKKDSITSQYFNSDEIITYDGKYLNIKNTNQIKKIDINKNLYVKIYFDTLKSIYYDDVTALEHYFHINKRDNEIQLNPKELVANYIDSIVYHKTDKLHFLTINLLNNDRITIEQID